MGFKILGTTGGSATQYGPQDFDKWGQYATGVADVDTFDINSPTVYRHQKLRVRNILNTFNFIIDSSNIVADRHIALPLLTVDDTFTCNNNTVAFQNKTMANGSNGNVITGINDAAISAHTSTKITITDRTHLPTASAYLDTVQAFTAVQKFDQALKVKPVAAPSGDASYGQFYPDSGDSNKPKFKKPDGTVIDLSTGSTAISSGPALYVPLFYYPNWYAGATYNWTPLINAITAYPSLKFVVTINISNGPGIVVNTDYSAHGLVDLRNAATAAGTDLKILGYVFTSYGARAGATVDADVDTWLSLYGTQVDGIFFDEMDNVNGAHEAYYTARTAHVKSLAWTGMVWGNPGTSTVASYVGTVDTILVTEADNSSRPSAATMASRTFNGAYPKTNFGAIIYNQGTLDTAYIDSSITPYFGYYWVTNDGLPNPYDSLPTYLTSLCSKLATSTTGGASGAAAYVTMASDGSLSAERVLTAGNGVSITDGGTNSTVTVAAKNRIATRFVTEQDVANTTTETDILAYTVPASTLGTDKALRVQIMADYLNNSGSDRTVTIKIKFGATTMYNGTTGNLIASATRRASTIEFILFAKNSVTSQGMTGHIRFSNSSGSTTGIGDINGTEDTTGTIGGVNASENSAVGKTLSCTITHSAAASTISYRRVYAVVEVLD